MIYYRYDSTKKIYHTEIIKLTIFCITALITALLIIIFITFIGVGLPDSVLGTAWPAIYREFNLPVSLYEIWCPTEMETTDKTYPLVVMVNGTGVVASKYKPMFDHLASWGLS